MFRLMSHMAPIAVSHLVTVWIEAASYPKEWFLKGRMCQNHIKDLLNILCWVSCSEFLIQQILGWGLRICVSNKFPSNIDAA